MHRWTELRMVIDRSPDEALLLDHVLPWVEAALPRLSAWHYFWEPDLWLRLRWSSEGDAAEGEARLSSACEALARDGAIRSFSFAEYQGDAPIYGAEAWPLSERDFTNASELSVGLIAHERAGTLTKERDFHWARHVHTFTNQLKGGSWAEEVRLTVRQARYRIWLLRRGAKDRGAQLDALLGALDGVLGQSEEIAAAEREMLERWRAADRPPMGEFLELAAEFDRDPAKHS
jgi:hypothetical protein